MPEPSKDVISVVVVMLAAIYTMKAYHFGDRIAIPTEKPRMTKVADYNDAECDLLFKFKKSHLRDMVKLLRFPEQVTFSNRLTSRDE